MPCTNCSLTCRVTTQASDCPLLQFFYMQEKPFYVYLPLWGFLLCTTTLDHNWYNIYKWNSTFSWLLRLLSSQIARTPSILAHCTVPSVNPFIVIIIIEQGCIISAQKRNWTDSWSTTVKQTQCPWQPFHAECIQKRNKKYFQDDDDEKRKMVTRILWNSDSCKSRWKTKL